MKQTEDKVERMLWLLEHRDEATDEEIRLLMDDDEVRDVYELMVLTDEAYRWADEPRRTLWWRKVAAAVAIVLLTGVAVASVGHFSMKAKPDLSDYACVMDEQAMTAIGDTVPQVVSGGTADICVFTDRELKDVLAVVACHYGVGKVAFRSDSLMHLRLYLQWDREASLDHCVSVLNHFERFSVSIGDDVLLVDGKQGKEEQP